MKRILISILIVLFALFYLLNTNINKTYYNYITADNHELEVSENKTTWIYFYSQTCGACINFSETLDLFTDETEVILNKVEVNIDDDYVRELLETYGIEATPTIVILDEENNEKENLVGKQDLNYLERLYVEFNNESHS